MKFELLFTTLVSLSSVANALPAFENVNGLQIRADEITTINGLPSNTIKCGAKTKYSKKDIQMAIEAGGQLQNQDKQVGPDRDNKYPFKIKTPSSLEGMPADFKDADNMQHFPMKNGKGAYNGKRPPKPERVMYLHDKGSNTATYVGLWTHEGAEKGQYKQCVEDSGETADTYNTGWCTAHITQWQRNENGVGNKFAFDMDIFDSQGDDMGSVSKQAVNDAGTLSVDSGLPYTVEVSTKTSDDDFVSICYANQCWTCDGSDGGAHDCTLGNGKDYGYENGNRDGDFGFTC
ncbi:hypothetical protein BJ170DRAFT_205328 [Xylariales sp. AK1849]|nr:hypothetical protein BJ170DRAFT_205328 [Xylariales sp. AK1849]